MVGKSHYQKNCLVIPMTKKVLKSWYSLLNTEDLEFEWGRDDESLDWYDKDCGLHIVIDGQKFYKSAFDKFEKSTQEVVEEYAILPDYCYEEYVECFPKMSQYIDTKDRAFRTICDIGCDYDNHYDEDLDLESLSKEQLIRTVKGLAGLVKEFVEIATIGMWRNE